MWFFIGNYGKILLIIVVGGSIMSLSFSSMKVALRVAIVSGHVPNVVGLQGIGKSDLVREFARENDYAFSEVTCSLIQEGDLAMPYVSQDSNGNKDVSYAINKIIKKLADDGKGKEYALLFLDEFNRANTQVQSELMNLVLQREVVGYKLPDNVRIILAMNPSSEMSGYENTDYSVSYSDAAMLGRIVSLDLEPSLFDWVDYGKRYDEVNKRQNVHADVLNYLSGNTSAFTTVEKSGRINNTPRGWKRASDLLYTYENLNVSDFKILTEMMRGTLDRDTADAFVAYYKSLNKTYNYILLASSTLESGSTDEWDNCLFKMNDAELDMLFKAMIDRMVHSNYTERNKKNLTAFVLAAQKELAYSWINVLDKKSNSLYVDLLDDEDFANYVLSMVVNVKNTEVGGFSGKK